MQDGEIQPVTESRCTRRPSKKVKEKVDFRIQFHATQVPQTSWDRLAVSLISLDSGRVTSKTRKIAVRNGQCQWPDALSETVRLMLDTRTHQYDEKLYKFVVAKGSGRSVLGEVIINMADYVSAASPVAVILPLRFCYAGTLLHVTIQCLTPKSTERPFHWLNSSSRQVGLVSDGESELHGCRTPSRVHQSPAHHLFRTLSVGSQSPTATSASGECSRIQPTSPTPSGNHAPDKTSGMISISYFSLSSPISALTPPPRDTPKETEHVSIDSDLHIEAAHQWKMFAEKIQSDMEIQKQHLANVKMEAAIERSSLLNERDLLKAELVELKNLNNELVEKERWKSEESYCIIQELKEELSLEKETNSDLAAQLNKLRDSNMELLLAVRDLEESLEGQDCNPQHLMKCKVYNNPCAEGGVLEVEEGFSEASYAAEATDKNIDRIIDLNRKEADTDERTPAFNLLISAFAVDVSNMRLVLKDFSRQRDGYTSFNEQLIEDLEALVRGSQSLVLDLQKRGSCPGDLCGDFIIADEGASSFAEVHDEGKCRANLEEKSLQLKELDLKVMDLMTENGNLEKTLKSYVDLEETRRRKMNNLESQLMEFAQELDYMQESNEQLESAIVATQSENQRLEEIVKNAKPKPEAAVLERVVSLESQVKRLEEEKEATFLENCVGENLARDLCEQLQRFVSREKHGDEQSENGCQPKDFIGHVKELRTLFSLLLKSTQESENRTRELQCSCDLLEDRLLKENEKAMATISFLDEQFGQLSKESDQLIGVCNEEVEMVLSMLEQQKTQGFLRVALEENVCEIAYLRDELRKMKEQTTELARQKEDAVARETERLNTDWQAKLADIEEKFKASEAEGQCCIERKAEVEALKAELVALYETLSAVKSERMREEIVFADDQARLQEQLAVVEVEAQEKHAEMQESVDQLETEASTLRATTEEILVDFEVLRTGFQDLVEALSDLKLGKAKSEAQLKELDAEHAKVLARNAASEQSASVLKAELERCKTLIDALTEEKAKLQKSHEGDRIADMKFFKEKLDTAESKLDMELQDLQAKLRSLELCRDSIHQDLHAKESLLLEKLVTLEALYVQMDDSFEAVVAELDQCKHEKSELEEIIKNLEIQVQVKEAAAETETQLWKARVSTLSDENNTMRAQVQQTEEEISQLKAVSKSTKFEHPETTTECELQTSILEEASTRKQMDATREEIEPVKELQGRKKWRKQHDGQEPEMQHLQEKIASLESELKLLNSSVEKFQEREAILCEKIVHLEVARRLLEEESILRSEVDEWKLVKANLEEDISRLQSQLQTESLRLAEKDAEYERLKKENEELRAAVCDWKVQEEQLMRTLGGLEGSSLDIASKELEWESLKQELQEKETVLWKRIEFLEIANEQLAFQQVDSGVDQLKKELTRLQNHNSELILREHELCSKLSTHSLLQLELQRLQEENEQLEQNFLKLKEASQWGDTLERIVCLEAELVEALETNNMYKTQLETIFSEQNKSHLLGNVDEIIGNLVSFKKRTSFLEAELKEMQERYLNMSMKFAELQSEREELLRTVKSFRSSR